MYRLLKHFILYNVKCENDSYAVLHIGIPTETVNAIMIIYKNTRSMVRSQDGDHLLHFSILQ